MYGLRWRWLALLGLWFAALCMLPDPRPLGAPEWGVTSMGWLGLGESSARALATVLLRSGGLALLGALLMLASGAARLGWPAALVVVLAPVLAVAALRLNYGYFPIWPQLQIAAPSAAVGALAGLALRRSRVAATSVVVVITTVFVWGTATAIDDELDAATRAAALDILAGADRVPDGDAGFAALLERAFAFAEDNSHGVDPVLPNRAAVLALGVILGDEQLVEVARRTIDASRLPRSEVLRARITVHGRNDWSRHFWVSAALTVLADSTRTITVGLAKELMDAAPGGSGFSFSDLAADAAGNRFALAATRDAQAARAMQRRVLAGVRVEDYLPDVHDLPEGLSRDVLQVEYGGLGGQRTQEIMAEIMRRLDMSPGLYLEPR